jgi:hypothetical protein
MTRRRYDRQARYCATWPSFSATHLYFARDLSPPYSVSD